MKKPTLKHGAVLMMGALMTAFGTQRLFMAPPKEKPRRQFYSLQSKTTDAGQVAELRIYDEIGFWGMTAKDFISQLDAIAAEAVEVIVAINSGGGDVFDAFAIYNALRRYAGRVTVRIDGWAASAASLVAMAGDTVIMPENTMMMIHDPWTIVAGTSKELRKTADMMDQTREGIVSAYRNKCGMDDAELLRLMDEETWMTALEAQALGFADVIEAPVRLAASARNVELLARFQKTPADLLALEVQTSAQPPELDPAPPPAPDPAPQPAPAPEASAAELVAHIFTACRAAGLANFAEGIVMATNLKDKASVDEAINNAKEIADICAAAKLPELAADYVNAGLKPEQVRSRLFDKLTQESAQRISNRPPAESAPVKAGGTTAAKVYSSRRKVAGKQ